MSELHAATALASLVDLDERLEERNRLAVAYTEALAGIPGILVPEVPAGDRSTYKDYSILIDADAFGTRCGRRGRGAASERASRPVATTRLPSTRCGPIGSTDRRREPFR